MNNRKVIRVDMWIKYINWIKVKEIIQQTVFFYKMKCDKYFRNLNVLNLILNAIVLQSQGWRLTALKCNKFSVIYFTLDYPCR